MEKLRPSGGVTLKKVVAEGRQNVEDCRNLVGFSVDDKRRILSVPGSELFPWPVLVVFLMSREVSGVVTSWLYLLR